MASCSCSVYSVSWKKKTHLQWLGEEEPLHQMTGLFKIFIDATTKETQPKATSVTEEGLGKEISFHHK